ncbi:MAG: hypothetical protein O3C10_03675 [Chloroflexi bacterium]|nr:hypothetical protein [Chloroflexota bacterium]
MAIIERRTFYGKVGAGTELVHAIRDEFEAMRTAGVDVQYRILTDYLSGRSDRVIYEIETDSVGALEEMMERAGAAESVRDSLARLEIILRDTITHAEVELLRVQD